jgi:hypothetical protein
MVSASCGSIPRRLASIGEKITAGQLPDNASDARAILREAQYLVDTWLHSLPAKAA